MSDHSVSPPGRTEVSGMSDKVEDMPGRGAAENEGGYIDPSEGARGRNAAPILDKDQMAAFVAMMGAKRAAEAMRKFALYVEDRLTGLATATPAELAAIAHGMIMMASQSGFAELAKVCAEVQREARQGAGLNRAPELRAAAERALAALRTCSPSL